MLVAEQCFNDINNSPVRYVRGRVELYNGSTLLNTFRHTDILKSFTIERVGDSSRFFGYGIVHKLNVKVLDKDRQLNITTANSLDVAFGIGSDFIYPYPIFYVSEVHRNENTNELSITAYDVLYRAANYTVSDLRLPNKYTIATFVKACAVLLGVPRKIMASGFDTFYPNGANFDGTETVREALNAVAEATQTIYYLNNEQELTFRRLDVSGAAQLDIGKDKYYSLDSKTNRRLVGVASITELGDNVSATLQESGTTQYVRDNPFWELRNDIATLVDAALAAVGGLTINQFECDWRGSFILEMGDKISLTTKDNKKVYSYVLDDVISYDGAFKEKTRWNYSSEDTQVETNPTNLGEALKMTYAKVDKANKQIDIVASKTEANKSDIAALRLDTESIEASVSSVASETETNKSNIAAIRLDTESISASVSSIEERTNNAVSGINDEISTLTKKVNASITEEDVKIQVQSELKNGVESITTETGYTFNNEGLTVAKSDSEMKTTISDDGMKVFKNDEAVLVANNVGVDAVNLSATTYLIIGTNSRFENYGTDRTGCFYLG